MKSSMTRLKAVEGLKKTFPSNLATTFFNNSEQKYDNV